MDRIVDRLNAKSIEGREKRRRKDLGDLQELRETDLLFCIESLCSIAVEEGNESMLIPDKVLDVYTQDRKLLRLFFEENGFTVMSVYSGMLLFWGEGYGSRDE